jgi:hypothetical protein
MTSKLKRKKRRERYERSFQEIHDGVGISAKLRNKSHDKRKLP